MTTTDRPTGRSLRGPGAHAARPLIATALIGTVLAVAALVTADGPAVWGVVVGVVLTVGSLGLGSLVLAWVTDVTPAMSLVVALMTYTLQVVLLMAAYVVLQGSEAAREAVSGPWLGATVISTTVVWLSLQVIGLMRARQPYFDLPAETTTHDTAHDPSADASRVGHAAPARGPEAGTP